MEAARRGGMVARRHGGEAAWWRRGLASTCAARRGRAEAREGGRFEVGWLGAGAQRIPYTHHF